jgi:hypothetical protein
VIRELRRRHTSLIVGVALTVPLLVVLALTMRPTPPVMAAAGSAPSTDSWTALGPKNGVRALVESQGGREWLHLVRDDSFVEPDVLVYWSPESFPDDEPMPPSTVLLGALGDPGAHTFNLPAREVSGILMLYSLPHRTTVGAMPVGQIRRLERAP